MNQLENNKQFKAGTAAESLIAAREYARAWSETGKCTLYIIWCNKTLSHYVCTDGLVRMFEKSIAIYENGQIDG
jgi:hypothetical protein